MVRYDYDRFDYTDRFDMDRREQERLERMIDEARRELDREVRREDPLVRVVNDPSIVLTPAEMKAINNPKMMMTPDRRLVKGSIGGRSPLYPPIRPTKRTRKKTKMDKTMSRCLKQANKQMRKKNGQLRKGKTMADVMRLAHRLCKKS